MVYQQPVINSGSLEYVQAMGQYTFEITNLCPVLDREGVVGQEGGLAFCGDTEGGFSAVITCQNISGTFNVVYGDAVSGGGLTCSGLDQSAIYPLLSVNPDLPGDCIVESFTVNGSNQC